jgi:hypothetical protein
MDLVHGRERVVDMTEGKHNPEDIPEETEWFKDFVSQGFVEIEILLTKHMDFIRQMGDGNEDA